MKLYGINFIPGTIKEYQELIPSHKSKRIFRNYLLNEYSLPEDLSKLTTISDGEVYPIRMNDIEIKKVEDLILFSKNKGFNVSRSAIIRDIYNNLINQYKNNPIPEGKKKRQNFSVKSGTKEALAKIINEGERTYELSSFIMEGYVPNIQNIKSGTRGQEKEVLVFLTDEEVFDKLDNIAADLNIKAGRPKVFRDAVQQFLEVMEHKEMQLQQELESVINRYKEISDPMKIKEKIDEYLT